VTETVNNLTEAEKDFKSAKKEQHRKAMAVPPEKRSLVPGQHLDDSRIRERDNKLKRLNKQIAQ